MFEREGLVDPIAVLINVIDLCIEPWIIALAATQMLPMRRRGLFLALELIGTPLWAFVFGTVLSWFWVGLLVCGILEFVLPLLFWRGSPFRKVSALFVIQLCSIVAGVVVWTCWEAIFGMPIPEDSAVEFELYRSDLGKWLIYEVLDIGLSAILLIPAVVLFRRWAWRTADTRGSVVFAGLLVAQLLMASVPMICMARSLGTGAYAVIALILLVYLVVGIGAIVASWHWEVAARAQRRSEELARQRVAYLEEYENAQAQVRAVAHLRHDLRNEMAAARALQERGRAEEARRLLCAMAERVSTEEMPEGGSLRRRRWLRLFCAPLCFRPWPSGTACAWVPYRSRGAWLRWRFP